LRVDDTDDVNPRGYWFKDPNQCRTGEEAKLGSTLQQTRQVAGELNDIAESLLGMDDETAPGDGFATPDGRIDYNALPGKSAASQRAS